MISPTQYTLYHRCPRAWWYRYVAGIKEPATPSQENGTAVHAAVEVYIPSGAWPVEETPAVAQARRAQAVLDAWTADHGRGVVEAEATLDLAGRGGLDRLGGWVDWHGTEPVPWVIDHKTIASPQYWLTPERLATDPQLLAYAGAMFPTGPDVLVGHLYIPPAPTDPVLVTAIATRTDIDATLDKYAGTTTAMHVVRAQETPETVEARTSGCWAYGGCFFADRCSAAPASLRRRNTPQEVTVSAPPTAAQAALRARLGLGGTNPPPAPLTAPTTPVPATETAPPTPGPSEGTPAKSPISDEDLKARLLGGTFASPRAVAPVEASPTLADRTSSEPPSPSVLPPDAPGRRRKSRAKDATETTGAALAGAVKVPTKAPAEDAHTSEGMHLSRPIVLVGCVTTDGAVTLEEWAGDALDAAVRDEKGTLYAHYLLVPFGYGPRFVAASLAADLATGRRALPARLAIPADHPVAPFLVPTLGLRAEIVRGVSR